MLVYIHDKYFDNENLMSWIVFFLLVCRVNALLFVTAWGFVRRFCVCVGQIVVDDELRYPLVYPTLEYIFAYSCKAALKKRAS